MYTTLNSTLTYRRLWLHETLRCRERRSRRVRVYILLRRRNHQHATLHVGAHRVQLLQLLELLRLLLLLQGIRQDLLILLWLMQRSADARYAKARARKHLIHL